MNEQAPDFIRNTGTTNIGSSSQKGFIQTQDENIPDFISNSSKSTSVSVKPDLKDLEVKQELGIDFDNTFSNNQEAVKEYVDNLSDEDYKTWTNLKNEWYSLDARKAMFDNKEDLYDINAAGDKKYWSWNTNPLIQWFIDWAQENLDTQNEIIHPWSLTTQEKLQWYAQSLTQPTYEDIKNRLSAKEWTNPILAAYQNSYAKPLAWWIRQTNVLWWLLLNLAAKGVSLLDSVWNFATQIEWELWNVMAWDNPWYDKFLVDPSQSVSLRASQIEAINDILWWSFAVSFPIATYIMTLIGSESETAQKIMDGSYKGIKRVTQQVVDLVWEETLWLEWLTDEEKELWYENVAMSVMILFWEALWYWWKKLSNTDAVKQFEAAVAVAKETSKFAKRTTENEIAQWVKWAMKDLPEWAQLTTKGWTPLFTNTASGIKPTAQWSLYLLTKLGWAKINWFIRWLEWIYKNKDKWLITRDPNAPVWDLPSVNVTQWEWTPKLEWKPTEIAESKPTELKTEAPKTEVPKTTKPKTSTIKEFVKSVKEDIKEVSKSTSSQKEVLDKLETSPALQSEYINTIDPYIKANWAENPSWVILEPLQDFVNTIKEQLEFNRNTEKDKMRTDIKTKVNIPNTDKVRYETGQKEYKDLIKLLSQKIENPEKFLKYLLKLPKETTNTLNKLIPDYSKNLQLIQDTLNLTKYITSTDLLWKFLNYKATRWTKDRNFLRKYLYKKLSEAYSNTSMQKKMSDIEQILNQMSEEELIQLEKDAQNGNLAKRDLGNAWYRNEWYMSNTWWNEGNRSLKEVLDSKRPWTNQTVWEYLESKWVKMTAVDNNTQYRMITKETLGRESLASYSENLDRMIVKKFNNPYKWFLFHEFGHRLFNQLGTAKMFDMLEYIAERDNISQEWAFERRAEYFRNYIEYNNIDGKKYLIKELGEAFDSDLLKIAEKTKQEVFDLFNIKDVQELEINQIMSDVKHDTEAGKEITSRKPQPLLSRRVWDWYDLRTEWLKQFDEKVQQVMPDYQRSFPMTTDSWKIIIKMDDWTEMEWKNFKKKIPEEDLKKIDKYEEDIMEDIIKETFKLEDWYWEWKFDYKKWENVNDITKTISKVLNKTKEDLGLEMFQVLDYVDQLRKIDPDIIGFGEKDGELTVKFLEQSYRERWEQADRPGQREIKEAKAIDFLTEEEIAQLPKELQELINKQTKTEDEIIKKLEEEKNTKSKKEVYLGERSDNYDSWTLWKWAKEQTEKEVKNLSEKIWNKEVIDWFEKYFDYELQRKDSKWDMFRDILWYLKGEKEIKDFTKTEIVINDFAKSVTKEINEKLWLNVFNIQNFHNRIKELDERIHNPEKFKKNIKGKEYTVYYL